MEHFGWVPVVIVFGAALLAAVTDVWKFRVYNVLTFPLIVSGMLYHMYCNGLDGLTISSLGVVFGLLSLIVPYLLGLMGAGDVKLMAGVGAWLGLRTTVVVFVVSSLVAGIYAVALIIARGKLRESILTLKLILYRFAVMGTHLGKDDMVEDLSVGADRRYRVIPFGAMVPLGVVGAVLWLMWLK